MDVQRLNDSRIYLPFYIGIARWGIFLFLKFLPSLFYRFLTPENTPVIPSDPAMEAVNGRDVTVVIAVLEPPAVFSESLASIIESRPFAILVIADVRSFQRVRRMCSECVRKTSPTGSDVEITVVCEEQAGKRAALCTGIRMCRTKLVCVVDDDVLWCPTLLYYMVIPFRHTDIGGVGVKQIAVLNTWYNIYDVLSNMRLAVRFIDLKATTFWDRGCSCISGRTACYRTSVVQTDEFYRGFMNEKYLGLLLVSGDDKYLTRFVVNRGYKTYHQLDSRCCLKTPFFHNYRFFVQLVRWSRNTWRSDSMWLFYERNIWYYRPFTALIILDKTLSTGFIFYGLASLISACVLRRDAALLVGWVAWVFASRLLKLIYYFFQYPHHLLLFPAFVVFQYLQAAIKLFAICTFFVRGWGTKSVTVIGNAVQRV
jgi:glycosyltransferase involved in cell wall biosynthesis